MNRFTKVFLAFLVPFILGVSFAVIGVNLLLQHFAGGYLVHIFNTKAPSIFNRDISIKDASVSLLKGQISLKDMQIDNPGEAIPVLFIPRLVISISLGDLLNDRLAINKVTLIKPVLNAGSGGVSKKDSVFSYIAGLRSLGVGPRNLIVDKGSFVIYSSSQSSLTVLSEFNMAITGMPLDESKESQSVKLTASALVPSVKPGLLTLNVDFASFYPKYNFEGEFKAKDIFIPYFTQYFAETGDIKVLNGTLGIKANILCSENWVTAGIFTDLSGMDLDITSKKIFGIPAEDAARFFETNNVAFSLPANGDIFNLKIDFKTASTQVMYQALRGRFKSESFTRRIAESFGKNIGEKLSEIFAKIL